MSYHLFTLESIEQQFGIKNQIETLLNHKAVVQPSETLRQALAAAQTLPLRSGKANAEAIVFPILQDLRARNERFFTIHSGAQLNADEEQNLNGICDFILSQDNGSLTINRPFFTIVQAEKGDLDSAINLCAAQMIATKIFNMKHNTPLETVFGCVTTGKIWTFMSVTDKINIDRKTYYTDNINDLMSAFQYALDSYKILFKDVK